MTSTFGETPLCASSGITQRSKKRGYSITSSARESAERVLCTA
jgi:hypothetical protein